MTSTDTLTRGRHHQAVDGLRAVAVVAVIAFHLSERRVPGAFLAVDVFFVISGFVITLTLLREHDRTGRISLIDFYRRRWWRLTPALALAVLLGLVLTTVSSHQSLGTWFREAVLGLTYTYNIGQAVRQDGGGTILNHLWSLSVEEQFYLVWAPLLALSLGLVAVRSRRMVFVAAAVLVLAIGRSVTAVALGNLSAFFLPWTRFDEFLCGALVAVALHGEQRPARLFTSAWPAVVAAAALVLMIPFVHIFVDDWMYHGGFLLVALLTAVVVGHAAAPGGSVVKTVLSWGPVVWLGQRSYGVYLYHLPLILAMFTMGAPRWLYGTAAPALTVLLAAASYRWVEVPLRRRGQRRPAWRGSEQVHAAPGGEAQSARRVRRPEGVSEG
ncbi:acyltransferase family protein [Blastococcus saxobsidens]|uniref:acyltransferase family protein n=1 Tax=Blastococcus saxobsidens TaxID=138336 RepID=UPI001315350E|nr:acyltransferase [Blastococcus saxobsidens]